MSKRKPEKKEEDKIGRQFDAFDGKTGEPTDFERAFNAEFEGSKPRHTFKRRKMPIHAQTVRSYRERARKRNQKLFEKPKQNKLGKAFSIALEHQGTVGVPGKSDYDPVEQIAREGFGPKKEKADVSSKRKWDKKRIEWRFKYFGKKEE